MEILCIPTKKDNDGWRHIQPAPAIWGAAGFSLHFAVAVIWVFRLRKAFILNAGLTIVVERLAAPNRARVIWSVRVNASRLCKQAGMSAY